MEYIEIVRATDGEIVKRIGPIPEHRLDRMEGAVNINLNHAEYYTRITEGEQKRGLDD